MSSRASVASVAVLVALCAGLFLTDGPALAATTTAAPAASAAATKESDDPIEDQGSNYDYRSYITGVQPAVKGLELEVLEFADRLVLRNHTGQAVTIYGYQDEPYARVLADGTVQINTRSPAYYLNQNFYANVSVPASASPTAAPQWTEIDRTGELEWHDHRIHWMSPIPPPQVKDKNKRTKIFDWQVPIMVGAQPATIEGQLFWVPEEGTKTPLWAIVAFAAIVIGGVAIVLVARRRRRGGGGTDASAGTGTGGQRAAEAW